MRLRSLLAGLAVVVATLAPARDASACSCFASGPPCQNTFQVDAVFVGTVSAITPLPDDGPPLREGEARSDRAVRVDFTGVVAYRGPQAPAMTVETPGSGASCGYGFKPGERYVVYATRGPDGVRLVTSICSRTRPLAEAGDDVRYLRTLDASTASSGRVSGTITHWERDLSTGQPREMGPLPNVLVTAQGPSSAFHAASDEQGRYEMAVPPGKYEIRASPPAQFSHRYQQQSFDLRDAHGCFVADFGVSFDGRLRGAVRHASGEPAAGARIQVMAATDAGKTGNIQTLDAVSSADGTFEFVDVSPARYLVGVDLVRKREQGDVFPPTYYPGTGDAASATVIELDGGEQRELEPIVLPPARRPLQLTGTILFEGGTPVSGAFVSLWDGLARWRQVAVGIKTQSDGTFSFPVHEGLSYLARVSYWNDAERRQTEKTVGPFVAGPDTRPLQVVLPDP